MRVWKFRQYKNDGTGFREDRQHRYIAPARAASDRYRRNRWPVCNCCGQRDCGFNNLDLREAEMGAIKLHRPAMDLERFWAAGGGFGTPIINHLRGRFYRALRSQEQP